MILVLQLTPGGGIAGTATGLVSGRGAPGSQPQPDIESRAASGAATPSSSRSGVTTGTTTGCTSRLDPTAAASP